ncbi:thiamine phosphate synthase [Gayadomonas joobiniege]|uniref:thiamine phosphate synthase n=1 Tax=Gayadomonas joobiniege TaxID=1234606 RepID=UPI0003715AFA|nr:thiamine phosphate synthase [Gayadomonas joobiniege]
MTENNNRPVVWTIAGSDCSGGAGIQADLKTMHQLGCDVSTVITANTAQNSLGIQQINSVTEEALLSQLDALAADRPPKAIKIGLLTSQRQVELVAEWLREYSQQQSFVLVYDPVATASAGGELTEEDTLAAIKKKLLPLVDVITPNGDEAQKLSGVYFINWSSMPQAAEQILKQGPTACIIKGGHIELAKGYVVDLACNGEQSYWLSSPRIETEHSHGSGCTYAAAITALFAQDYLLRDAATVAKAYVNQALRLGVDYSGIYGPVNQAGWPLEQQDQPQVLIPSSPLAEQLEWQEAAAEFSYPNIEFADCETLKLGLYPVVDSLEWIQKLAEAGVKTLQIRIKHQSIEEVNEQIAKAVAIGRQYQLRLFINDYWQLAIKHQAYGVHLGQEDLQQADLAAIAAAGLRLGISTHGEYELLLAHQLKPSYLAIGAIYPTRTKDMTGQIQGIARLSRYTQLIKDIPLVAIGGISLARAREVAATGIGSIAAVTAITEADDYRTAIVSFEQALKQTSESV